MRIGTPIPTNNPLYRARIASLLERYGYVLAPKQRMVLSVVYGFDGESPRSQGSLARQHGVCPQAAAYWRKRAEMKLEQELDASRRDYENSVKRDFCVAYDADGMATWRRWREDTQALCDSVLKL